MTEFRSGDKVRVTYDALVQTLGDNGRVSYVISEDDTEVSFVLRDATVELVGRADDPSKDPIGTMRCLPDDDGQRASSASIGDLVIKWDSTDENPWAWFRWDGPQLLSNETVTDWPVIGSVPGTPAAEQGAVPRRVAAKAAELLLAGEKINAIKAVREAHVGLDLKASKVFVESLPEHAIWARGSIPHAPQREPRVFQSTSSENQWQVHANGDAFFRYHTGQDWRPCEATFAGLATNPNIKEVVP
jgi:hypothetical protein